MACWKVQPALEKLYHYYVHLWLGFKNKKNKIKIILGRFFIYLERIHN